MSICETEKVITCTICTLHMFAKLLHSKFVNQQQTRNNNFREDLFFSSNYCKYFCFIYEHSELECVCAKSTLKIEFEFRSHICRANLRIVGFDWLNLKRKKSDQREAAKKVGNLLKKIHWFMRKFKLIISLMDMDTHTHKAIHTSSVFGCERFCERFCIFHLPVFELQAHTHTLSRLNYRN